MSTNKCACIYVLYACMYAYELSSWIWPISLPPEKIARFLCEYKNSRGKMVKIEHIHISQFLCLNLFIPLMQPSHQRCAELRPHHHLHRWSQRRDRVHGVSAPGPHPGADNGDGSHGVGIGHRILKSSHAHGQQRGGQKRYFVSVKSLVNFCGYSETATLKMILVIFGIDTHTQGNWWAHVSTVRRLVTIFTSSAWSR